MSPLYDVCGTCGWLVPADRKHTRCPVCHARLVHAEDVEPDVGSHGAAVGMMLAAMGGGLVGAAITLLLAC
jgi:hypothetical protein